MNKAIKLAYEVEKVLGKFELSEISDVLKNVPQEWQESIHMQYVTDPEISKASVYYKWLYCLVKHVKPKQIVELGGAQGVSSLMMSAAMPAKCKLFSVDLVDDWRVLPSDSKVIKIVGRSEDETVFPKGTDLEKTDIWFIDTAHFQDQLQKEFDAYSKYWKEGTIVILDDVDYYWDRPMHDLYKFWPNVKYNKVALPHLHVSGFGLIVV